MSNPYDPNQDPPQNPGQQPYGPPQEQPYGSPQGQSYGPPQGQPFGAPQPSQEGGGFGSNPYGGDNPYGNNEPKGTDAVSITGFVLSLTCCLSIVGLILGFVGLGRTKGNQRKGRWAAIAAIPIGTLGTLAAIGFVVAIVFVAKHQITPDNATVGQCASTDTNDNTVSLTKKDCSESHDAQIVYAGKAGSDADKIESGAAGEVCTDRDPSIAKLTEYNLRVVIEDPKDVDADDRFACYIEKADGGKLDEKVDLG